MIGILDKYLAQHNLTRYQLAKATGVAQTTWLHANDRPLDRWTVKQIRALAECTGSATTTVLRELEMIEDDRRQVTTRDKEDR